MAPVGVEKTQDVVKHVPEAPERDHSGLLGGVASVRRANRSDSSSEPKVAKASLGLAPAYQQAIAVTVAVYGPTGSAAPTVVQDVPVTHLPDVAQAAWRATDIPLPEG